jgi:RNA polymerase sigma-70 factor (ECF subfamily)
MRIHAMTGKLAGKLLSFRRKSQPSRDVLDLSDEALVAACGVGDSTALAALFARYGDRVHGFLARTLREPTDVEDLVQATFVQAYKSARAFERRSSVIAWLLGIAINLMRTHVRGETRRRNMLRAAADVPRRESRRPDDEAVRNQLLGRLDHGVRQLPDDLRVVFVIRYVEGIKGEDAARLLRMTEGTFWRKLHEARLLLREALESGGRA